jgi:hypothetical protein
MVYRTKYVILIKVLVVNKMVSLGLTWYREAFAQSLLSCKSNNIKDSECVFVALVIQHAKRMLSRILSCLAVFYTLAHKRYDFRNKLLNIKFVF